MHFETISAELLDQTPKSVLAMAYASSRDGGHAIAVSIDDAIRTEWAMSFVRGHVTEKPPFDYTVFYSEADEQAMLNETD